MSSSDNKPLPPAPTSTPASPTTSKKTTPELDSPKRSKSPTKPKSTSSPTKPKSSAPNTTAKESVAGTSTSEKDKVASTGDKKNHNRKGSSKSGGSQSGPKPATVGGASAKSATVAAKADGTVTPASEGLSNLKNIISELKDNSTPPAVTAAPSTSTNASTKSTKHHKSSGSASNSTSTVAPNVVVSQAPSTSNLNASVSSNLNPNAGGFQPGTLGVISDHMDEASITPTASQFDLMTGMPSSSRGQGLGGGSFAFPPSPNPLLQQQQIQHQQSLVQQQQYLQLQAQQQQFQLQQLALLGYGPGSNASTLMNSTNGNFNPSALMGPGVISGNGLTPAELMMAEQMAIQQQLEALRLQQAALLTRFSEMQVAAASTSSSGLAIPQSQSLQSSRSQETGGLGQVAEDSSVHPNRTQSLSGPAGHRRIHSQQDRQGGQMGSFGSFGGSHNSGGGSGSGFNNLTSGSNGGNGNNSLGYSTSLPKGHGRRHSVNTLNKSTNGHQSSPSNGGGNGNNGIFGSPLVNHSSLQPAIGLRNSFTFPNNGNSSGNNNNGNHRSSQAQDLDFGNNNNNNGGNGSFGHARRQSGSVSSLGGWSMNNNINSSNSTQANLAEAQSHLQQLAAYRASAGHSRVPSFGMSLPGGGPGQLSMSGYGGGIAPSNQNGNGGGGNNQMRKSLFAPYLPQASIPPLLAAGKLVIGILRVNKRNRSDAYVTADGLDSDIYVCG